MTKSRNAVEAASVTVTVLIVKTVYNETFNEMRLTRLIFCFSGDVVSILYRNTGGAFIKGYDKCAFSPHNVIFFFCKLSINISQDKQLIFKNLKRKKCN